MTDLDATSAGLWDHARRVAKRLSMNRAIALIAFAMVLVGACSVAIDSGHVEEPLDDSDHGIPAHSLTVTGTIQRSPGSTSDPAYIGEEVTFWANASSDTGAENLTFTIYYDGLNPWTPNPASAVSVNTTGNPGAVVQKYTYNALGNFTGAYSYYYVLLYVDDGSTNQSFPITVYVTENNPPEFVIAPGDDETAVDVPLNITIEVYDPDSDPLDILWEFGDGETATNVTDGTYANRFVNQTHTWDPYVPPGAGSYSLYYTLNVTVTDPFGNNVSESVTITVTVPLNRAPTIAISASSSKIQPGDELQIWANATDPEGDPLTWTFNYSDGVFEVVHTNWSEPGELVWCNMTHVYEAVGNYTITMWVSDAIEGYQVWPHNKSKSVSVTVAVNKKPGVTSTITVVPESPEVDADIGFVDVTLEIQVADRDGDVVTATWYIPGEDDSPVNTSAGGTATYTFRQIMTLTDPGSYNVSVVVTDGYYEVLVWRIINATSNNMPPYLVNFTFVYATGDFAIPGEELEITIVFSDPEQDALEVILDFGDDTPQYHCNLTDYVAGNVTLTVIHAYDRVGVFDLVLWYTDNKIGMFNHTKTVTSEVKVQQVYVKPPIIWDWWDYTSLSLVFVVPAVIVARMMVIKRKINRLEQEGLTLEEARMKDETELMKRLLEGGRGDN